MSTPAIKHTDLFDFDGYQNGIESLNKSTADFVNNTNKLIGSLKGTYADLQSQLTGKKVTIVDTNDAEKLKQVDSEINALSVSIKNNRDAVAGLNTANKTVSDSAAGLASNAKALQLQYASLTDEEKKNETIGGAIVKQMAAQKVASKEFSDAVQTTAKDLAAADGSYSQLSNSLLKMRNELKNMPGAFDPATGGINKNNKAAVDLAAKIADTDKAVKAMDGTMGQFGRNVGNYEGAMVPLKKQLREITQTLQQMQLAGQEDSLQFEELTKKAGEIRLAMSEVGESVKSAGAKFLGLKAGLEVMEGITAGASVATGAMALFGNENEKFKENLIKLESAMVIMQGLQKISALLEKDSMAVRYILNTQAKLQILYSQLQGAAESKNIVVRYAAAAAQWVLNAAMNANPVGILIAAAVILAGAFLFLSRNTQKATEAQIRLNEAQKRWIEQKAEEATLISEGHEEMVNDAEEDLKLAKAKNATQIEQMNLEVEVLKARKDAAMETKILYASDIKDLDTLREKYKSLKGQLDLMIDSTRKGDEKGQKEIEAVKGQVENLATRIKGATSAQENYFKADSDLAAKNYENKQFLIERDFKSTIASDEAKLASAKIESKAEYDARIKLLNDKRDIELKNVNLTNGEIKKINADHNKAVAETTKAYNEKVAKSEIDTRISGLNYELALSRESSRDELEIKKKLVDEQAKLELLNAQNSIYNEDEKAAKIKEINAKSIREKENLEKEMLKMEIAQNRELVQVNKDAARLENEAIIASSKSSISAKIDAFKAIKAAELQGYDEEFASLNMQLEKKLISEEQYQIALVALKNKYAEIKNKIEEDESKVHYEKLNASYKLAGEIGQSLTDISKNQSDARIDQLNAEKDKEIAAAGDNANAKTRIENEYNRKIAKEKAKQAKIDKANALFQIAINTAIAVTSATASASYFMIPFVIATGLLEAAVVMAKPLPAYRRGTRNAPEGMAIVNDEPGGNYQETIERDGKLFMPRGRNSVVNLKRGDKVYTAVETMNIFRNVETNRIAKHQSLDDELAEKLSLGRKMEVEYTMANAINMNMAMLSDEIGKKVGNEVGLHIANMPQSIQNWDENGYRKATRRGNTIIHDQNKSNSL